jgi:fatty-acid desaturase
MNIQKGFLYAHLGWVCYQQPDNKEIDTKDVEKDPAVQIQSQYYYAFAVVVGLVVPAVLASFWGDALVRNTGNIFLILRVDFCTQESFVRHSCCMPTLQRLV